MSTEKIRQERIVEARLKLKVRFEEKMKSSPSMSDIQAQGQGSTNRHGMPQVPVGQTITDKWPILDLGYHPKIDLLKWRLTIDGEVDNPVVLKWDDFMDLPQTKDISDFHCVTSWSKLDISWVGVQFADLAALVSPKETATHVLIQSYDTYTTNLKIEEALKPDVLIAHKVYNEALPIEHGGPARMITPQLYAWKGAKWIKRIQFLSENKKGFWEERGYSDTAYPWQNDRYS